MDDRKKQRTKLAGGVAAIAIVFVGAWEGRSLIAYYDPIGIPTICEGITKGVKIGDTATPAECDALLIHELKTHEAGLAKCLNPAAIPDKTWVAFVSWTYNVGVGAACRSTLVRKANAGDLVGACNQLPRWNRAGGRIWRGLVNRRSAEQKLCLEGLN